MTNQNMNEPLGFEVALDLPYEKALEKVIAALKVEGFGVLTRIDVQATLKEKIGVDFHPYTILGACNPPLAHRALSANGLAGLLLPCNVTVESTSQDRSLVRIVNPQSMLAFGDLAKDSTVKEVSQQARARLERVAQSLI